MQWLLALLMSNLTLSKVKIQQLLLQMTIIVNKDRTFQIWVNYLKTKPQTYFFTLCYAIFSLHAQRKTTYRCKYSMAPCISQTKPQTPQIMFSDHHKENESYSQALCHLQKREKLQHNFIKLY